MLFRVTLSNDVNEYYKDNSMDVQMSMTVEAKSFNAAILTAQALSESYLFWPSIFEVVSVVKVDNPIEEKKECSNCFVAVENLRNGRCRNCNLDMEPIKKAPEIWCLDTGIQVMDPDGWRRKGDPAWDEPITRDDFLKRAYMSTVNRWPKPLWDEVEDCGDDSACDEPLCPSYHKYD